MYISWAAFYEGSSDAAYFNVLIPRLLDEILRANGKRPYDVAVAPSPELGVSVRSFDTAAREICARENEFHIIFVHADTGGDAQERKISDRREALVESAFKVCGFNRQRAVYVSPKHETEAWALCDRSAVLKALGVSALPDGAEVPEDAAAAEALTDPKQTLAKAIKSIRRKNAPSTGYLVRIAQEQSLEETRKARSFAAMQKSLENALRDIGCLEDT